MTSSRTTTEQLSGLQRLSLKTLLFCGFGAIALAALVAGAGVFITGRLVEHTLHRYRAVDAPVADLASRASESFLQARRYEKDYFLALRTLGTREAGARYVTLWQTSVEDVLANLSRVSELAGAGESELGARASAQAALLKQYESGFLAAVELVTLLGFFNTGIDGEMQRVAEQLEERLRRARPHETLTALLELRRYEKNYALRGRVQDANGFGETVSRLRRQLASGNAPQAERRAALELLGRYEALFQRYVQVAEKIDDKRRDYLAVAQNLEPGLAKMQYDVLAEAADALGRLDALQQRSVRVVGIVGGSILAGALWLAFVVARKITVSTRRAVGFAESISRGELEARLVPLDGRELQVLGQALNRMADSLEEKIQARDRHEAEIGRLNADLEARVEQRTQELERANVQLTERNREVALSSELTSALQSALTAEEAGGMASHYLARLLPGRSGGVYLVKASGNSLERFASWGEPVPAAAFAQEECWALRRGEVYGVPGREATLRCAHAAAPGSGEFAYVCVPMSAQGAVLGLLHVRFDSHADGAARRELSEQLARHLALALANLKLRDTLREQSIRDPLTGLYNRRYLEETFERELARARREQRPLSVFMLDVDHFKKFNDVHGHEAGDLVLRALGRALRASCRVEDVPCRYGGEEFTVLLPGADIPNAAAWAERFMERVREMEVKGEAPLPKITVSLGLAAYPEHGDQPALLMQAADEALYKAKSAGRDRMVAAQSVLA